MSVSEDMANGLLCCDCGVWNLNKDHTSACDCGYPIRCADCAKEADENGAAYWDEEHGVCIWGE